LHASAVRLGDAAVAFSGISGAGKTTTARAFVAAGAGFVCEDKLAIKLSDSGTYVAVDGEKLVADWVSSAAGDLVRTGTAACSRLDFAATGTMVPLAEIGFLDVRRRSPGSHAGRSLSPLEVAGAVFRNAFYGSDVSKEWIRHLHVAAMIGRTVRGYELTLPDGLDRLAQTAAELTRVSSIRS
jgi:hypothetical protein